MSQAASPYRDSNVLQRIHSSSALLMVPQSVTVTFMLVWLIVDHHWAVPATAITEFAGPFWSGRALGAQNTAQRVMAAAAPPVFGALITAVGYPIAFAVCALFPLLAVPVVPVKSESLPR